MNSIRVIVALGCMAGVCLAIGILVWRDAKKLGLNPWLWALVAVLLPAFLGLILYLLVRGVSQNLRCPKCDGPVRNSFLVCPHCGTPLRPLCPSCGAPMERGWKVCPYCAAALPEEITAVEGPREKKQSALGVLIGFLLLLPILMIIGMLAFANVGTSTSGLTVASETQMQMDNYYKAMEEQGEDVRHIRQLLQNLDVDADLNRATALVKTTKTENGAFLHRILLYVPGGDGQTRHGFGNENSIFGTTVKVEVERTGNSDSFLCLEVSGKEKLNIQVHVDGKKISCRQVEVDFNPLPQIQTGVQALPEGAG